MKYFFLLFTSVLLLTSCTVQKQTMLKNAECSLELGGKNGLPVIERGVWRNTGNEIFSQSGPITLGQWLPSELIGVSVDSSAVRWQIKKQRGLQKAECSKIFSDVKVTWRVELFDGIPFFRTSISLKNIGVNESAIKWFPIWAATWRLPNAQATSLHTWRPLSYEPLDFDLTSQTTQTLFSNLYSSDSHGVDSHVPFWQITGGESSIFFSLAWSGGWQADFVEKEKGTNFQVKLPPQETQLTLSPDESITGPYMYVSLHRGKDPVQNRKEWLAHREQAASMFYNKPDNWSPFLYNHWYSCRFDLSGDYLQQQMQAMQGFDFDVFVIDAGWYNGVGDWRPNQQKFAPGEFEKAFQDIKKKGIKTGIWTCPWLVEIKNEHFTPDIEEPRFYRKFMNAYALDLANTDFDKTMLDHLDLMKKQFPVDWWKYDQELFGDSSRAGKMKNVIALQNSLAAARQAYPHLNIENCMSGGRMINEFTDQIAQAHWIRDGGGNGYRHARANIKEALGAAQFIAPQKIQRWTNRPNELDENDVELMKFYCRSAMIGSWGVSADLNKISDKQREIIIKEATYYRALADFKTSLKYDIFYPQAGNDVTGIIFYHEDGEQAAVLMYRWDGQGPCTVNVNFNHLPSGEYILSNWDSGDQKRIRHDNAAPHILRLDSNQLSTIYSIARAK